MNKVMLGFFMKKFWLFLTFVLLPVIAVGNKRFDSYTNKSLIFRRIVNHSTVFYLDPPNDSLNVIAFLKSKKPFLLRKDREVHILQIKDKRDKIRIIFEGRYIGRHEVEIVSQTKTSIDQNTFDLFFNMLFSDKTDTMGYKYYVTDPLTNQIHARRCNHYPKDYKLVSNISTDSNSICKACFPVTNHLDIPNLRSELSLGQHTIREYKINNPIVYADSINARITTLGKKVLENWPIELLGYDYKFYVIKRNDPNAMAAPGGTIFIHTSLIELAKNDCELEAIIAHEIAHVEMRHGYRAMLKNQKGELWGALAVVSAGLVVGVLTEDSKAMDLTTQAVAVVADVALSLSLDGYGRDQEIEADDLARLYLFKEYGDSTGAYLISSLKKMLYFNNIVEKDINSSYGDTHPKLLYRQKHLRTSHVIALDKPISYVGRDSSGLSIIEMSIKFVVYEDYEERVAIGRTFRSEYKTIHHHKYSIYANVFSSEFLYKKEELKHFKAILDSGEKVKFDNKEDTPILPLSNVRCLFVYESITPIDPLQIDSLELNFGSRFLSWEKVVD